LGDAVLDFLFAKYSFEKWPKADPGVYFFSVSRGMEVRPKRWMTIHRDAVGVQSDVLPKFYLRVDGMVPCAQHMYIFLFTSFGYRN
jgi:hypothetical protein